MLIWAVVGSSLAALAPGVESALSGAGWQSGGSESVQARQQIDDSFAGAGSYALQAVVHSRSLTATDPRFRQTILRVQSQLRRHQAVSAVTPPQPGVSISRDGHTAVIRAGAAGDPDEMVAAAGDLKASVATTVTRGMEVNLTGAAGTWSDFNEANREAMLRSELISWPITLAILILAFGSLVAAGLPLLLTIVGLIASAGVLHLGTFIFPISIWAMNFALMFALALGIDYALFIVIRFRKAVFGQGLAPTEALATTMDTAGKAVLFSGLTVVISLSAVMLVPSPAFRSTALGIIVSTLFVLAAALTLLPAVLAMLGSRVDKFALPWVHSGERPSRRFESWGELLWRRPVLAGGLALVALLGLAMPILDLRTAMPSLQVIPRSEQSRRGYEQVSNAFGPGTTGTLQIIAPRLAAKGAFADLRSDRDIAATLPPVEGSGGTTLIEAVPAFNPSTPAFGSMVDRLRTELPPPALIGGTAAENHDLERSLEAKAPLVIGVVLGLGFLLLLLAFRAPLIAMIGVLTSALSTGAAFGVAKLIFQDGHLSGLLGFEPQGFLDAWGPVYFFAMIFAIAMDYTVFLLSSAREHWEASGDAKKAMVGSLTSSGRAILAAAAVMVAVFFTFALSGPLAPKEMGVILGVAVLLDACLVRLLLVPTFLRLLGNAAWHIPAWLDRVLPEIHFGHATPPSHLIAPGEGDPFTARAKG